MAKYIGKRLLMMIPVIIGVVFIIYSIMELTPGDPVMMILGEGAPIEAQEALREQMGLNAPFLVRFVKYVIGALHGDLGTSYTSNLPVFNEIVTRLPYTLSLATFSICVAVIIGLPIGILSAIKQYSITDNLTLAISLTITSMPAFFLAMLLIMIFSIRLGWLPMMGLSSPKHFILPVIASASSTTAALMRMTRTTMLEVIRQDYIRTAKAKGASPRRVTYGHALRNALLPVVTVIGTNFGFALGGSIVLEQVFTIPGLGQLMINAIRQKDTPIVMGAVMTTAIFASLINLLVDIVYTYIDPRLASRLTSVKRGVKSMSTQAATENGQKSRYRTVKKKSQWKTIWIRFKRNKLAVAGLVVFLIMAVIVLSADLWLDYESGATTMDLANAYQAPSAAHIFGTDQYGRDYFTRVVFGGRISMFVGIATVAVSLTFGGLIGATAAYYGGKVDEVLMRCMDVLMAIPSTLLAITIISALGSSLFNMIIAMGVSQIARMSRIVRSAVMSVKDQEYIEACRACGTSDARIILRHILPNAMGPVLVQVTQTVARSVITVASLSFVGLGVSEPTPEWGGMLSFAKTQMRYYPYLSLFPGFAVVMSVMSLTLAGDGLRDAMDPRLRNG